MMHFKDGNIGVLGGGSAGKAAFAQGSSYESQGIKNYKDEIRKCVGIQFSKYNYVNRFFLMKVREICEIIGSGIQPLQNTSVVIKLSDDIEKRTEWAGFWIEKGFAGRVKI